MSPTLQISLTITAVTHLPGDPFYRASLCDNATSRHTVLSGPPGLTRESYEWLLDLLHSWLSERYEQVT